MKTSDRILEATREILAEGGIGAVSFDAIARRLGVSKQAVLYWFPSKRDLLAKLFLGWLQAEADATGAALNDSEDPVAAFAGALVRFHRGDMARFRAMYLMPQTLRQAGADQPDSALLDQIHETTAAMYRALADRLPGDRTKARQEAVAIHAAALGLVTMLGLADAVRDPLKHSEADLIRALLARLAPSQRP